MPNITLKRFMIFNSSEGHDECREGDKLLYHWTKEALDYKVSLAEQIDDICLCDASVNVSNRLNCDVGHSPGEEEHSVEQQNSISRDSCTSNGSFKPNEHGKSLVLTFDSTLVLIVEVEPRQSIWMAVHVAPPLQIDTSSCDGSTNHPVSHQQQQTDPSCIPADAIERVMNNIYTRFCLLNGTFQMIADEARSSMMTDKSNNENNELDSDKQKALIRDRMRSICESYFNVVLPDIHLNSIVSNVASLYNYILYLDLNPLTLMKVNSFINHLICVNAIQIRHTIVIFNDQLLWSSLNMYDTRLLYNYLVSVLIRDALQEELSKEVDKVRRIKENMPLYLMEDILGKNSYLRDDIINSNHVSSSPPREKEKAKLTKLYLTVFRSSNNLTLGLILSESNLFDLIQKCEQILTSDSRLGVIPLASLAQSVGQNFLKSNSSLQHHQSPVAQSTSQQQTTASTTMAANASSTSSWRRSSFGNVKNTIPIEQKYVFMDRLDVSISWPLSMDMQNKEHLLLASHDNNGLEIQSSNKKLRLIRYLIDLEPELHEIKQKSGSSVEEFFGRTLSDSWLTVTNSKYRTIYSVHSVRNSGLSEAQQSAINLKSVFASSRQ